MSKGHDTHLSRRERQIMDVLYQSGSASAKDVMEKLPNPPGYSSVRALLARLEDKGHIAHKEEGPRYLYYATTARNVAGENALQRTLKTFFNDSPLQMVNTLLDLKSRDLTAEEIDELEKLIDQAKQKGR